jgi:hypothetical protein
MVLSALPLAESGRLLGSVLSFIAFVPLLVATRPRLVAKIFLGFRAAPVIRAESAHKRGSQPCDSRLTRTALERLIPKKLGSAKEIFATIGSVLATIEEHSLKELSLESNQDWI